MQEEEQNAVTEASEESVKPVALSVSEEPDTPEPEQNPSEAQSAEESISVQQEVFADKISAIRSSLVRLAQEQDEEAVSLRVAYQIK